MKYIFLDNQIYIYMFEKDDTEQLKRLKSILSTGNIRLVVSIETLKEFSQSYTLDQALNLARKVIDLNPVWIDGFANIQRIELNQFIFENLDKVSIFKKDFHDFFGNKNITPIYFIEHIFNNYKKQLNSTHEKHQKILKKLLRYSNKELYNSKIEKITLNNKICKLLPQNKLNQLNYTIQKKRDLVSYCIKNKNKLYKECLSLGVEHYLAKYRVSDKNRKPRISDSKDYTISIASFPYVDFFITNDSFLYDGLKYVNKHFKSNNTKVYKSLTEIN